MSRKAVLAVLGVSLSLAMAIGGAFLLTGRRSDPKPFVVHACWTERNISQPNGEEIVCGDTSLADTPYFVRFISIYGEEGK